MLNVDVVQKEPSGGNGLKNDKCGFINQESKTAGACSRGGACSTIAYQYRCLAKLLMSQFGHILYPLPPPPGQLGVAHTDAVGIY